MKGVKFRFIQSLNKEERKKLKGFEHEFYEAIKNNNRGKLAYLYEIYTEEIMDLLEQYGYLIPKKKDSTRIS